MIKLILVDLDGTLLNDSKEVSDANRAILRKAYQKKGIPSAIVTGRPYAYIENLELDPIVTPYAIACGGGVIKNRQTGETLIQNSFTREEVRQIRDLFIDEKADFFKLCIFDSSLTQTQNDTDSKWKDFENLIKSAEMQDQIDHAPDFSAFLCSIGAKKGILKRVLKKLKNQAPFANPTAICETSFKAENKVLQHCNYIDIVKAGCNKKIAIQHLIQKLDIAPNEVMVLGDGINDVPMFEAPWLKVAMDNAAEEIRERANYITSTNNEDGVAKAINRFLF